MHRKHPGSLCSAHCSRVQWVCVSLCVRNGLLSDWSAHTHTHTHTHTHLSLAWLADKSVALDECTARWRHQTSLVFLVKISLHPQAHTHTHVGFYGLRGLSIGVMVFILYKLYVLLPYTYPTPKPSPHRRRCISIFPQKNSLCMIYKHFKLWGHWKCPHKSPSPCNTYVIPMSLYKFVSS